MRDEEINNHKGAEGKEQGSGIRVASEVAESDGCGDDEGQAQGYDGKDVEWIFSDCREWRDQACEEDQH